MPKSRFRFLGLLILLSCRSGTSQSADAKLDAYLSEYDREFQRLSHASALAEWESNTHIVEGDSTNSVRTRRANEALARFVGQGVPAAALAWHHRATGDPASLAAARDTANAAVAWLARGERLWHQPPVFNAIAFRGLLAVHDLVPVEGLLGQIDGSRDPATGLFTRKGIGSYDGRPAIDQAGLVQLFAVRAAGSAAWVDRA